MKTLLTLFISSMLMSNELKWVDEQINAIEPSRSGITKAKVNSIRNPFITLKKNTPEASKKTKTAIQTRSKISASHNTLVKEEKKLTLEAIINKSALINGIWYKQRDKVGKYTLDSVDRGKVLLSLKDKELLLSIKVNKKNLTFKNK